MKCLLITALFALSIGTYAEETAKSQEPPPEPSSNWPTLEKYWFEKNHDSEFLNALIGTPSAEVKLGYEYSDLDDPAGNDAASALISRVRLNYMSGNYKGFEAFVQAQYVGPLTDKHAPKDPTYDTVADPEAFRFHQLYLAWSGYDTRAVAGAQEIILDNARFIGNVGWRFNAQSFNAGLVQNESIDNLKMFYAYTDSINAPDGENNDNRQYHLLNGEYRLGDHQKVSGYAYLQRNDGADPFDVYAEIDTYGLRSWSEKDGFSHNLMLALQRKAYYGWLSGKMKMKATIVEGGIEYLSGGNEIKERFQTLNGTAHAFNGWADQFLGTGGGGQQGVPLGSGLPAGLIDLWLKGSITPANKLDLIGVYHYFNTSFDDVLGYFSGSYGSEIDLMAKYKVHKNFDLVAALAYYMRGDDHMTNHTNDETVFWLRGTLRF